MLRQQSLVNRALSAELLVNAIDIDTWPPSE